jgi:ribosomal protein S18 acetylase RimI-like enzyme
MEVTPVRLALAQPSDHSAVVACVDAAYSRYLERMEVPPAPMLADYGALIDRGVVHVATMDGDVVGLTVMWAEPDHFYLDNIAVDPTRRGMGIGSFLLDQVEAAARAEGRHEIRLYTHEKMTENLDYYPRHGYVETHRAVGEGRSRVYFSKHLS